MKKKLIYFFLPILYLFLALGSVACTDKNKDDQGLRYQLSQDKSYYIVLRLEKTTASLISIPSTFNNKPVRVIAGNAFFYCEYLTKISIPPTISAIGEGAFEGCHAFEVYIEDVSVWCNIDFSHYSANPLYYASRLYVNHRMTPYLVIPDNVTKIGKNTFYHFYGLSEVTIPDGVTSIGNYAFAECKSLTTVILGNGMKTIEENAFKDSSNLNTVYYHGTENGWNEISIGNSNSPLTSATRYYYSETEQVGCWRYVNGKPTLW